MGWLSTIRSGHVEVLDLIGGSQSEGRERVRLENADVIARSGRLVRSSDDCWISGKWMDGIKSEQSQSGSVEEGMRLKLVIRKLQLNAGR